MKIFQKVVAVIVLPILLFSISMPVFASGRIEWPTFTSNTIQSESAVLMDANTGTVLYDKNMNVKQYPASITKIMTALLTLEHCSLDEIVTFSKEAVFGIEVGSSNVGIVPGEELTVEQCLYALLLSSANEVASALGEHVAGTAEAFAQMMTEKAKSLGCENTNFMNANGLHHEEHYTTAYDMALITREAMNYEAFRTISGTTNYTIPPTNKTDEERTWITNHNQMIFPKYTLYYEGCEGGKTGYTTKALQTLVNFAKRDGVELICVTLRCRDRLQKWTDHSTLFDFGFENFEALNIAEADTSLQADLSTMDSTGNLLFSEAADFLQIDSSDLLCVPKGVVLDDLTKEISYDNQNSATVSYYYGEKLVGSTTLELVAPDSGMASTMAIFEENSSIITSSDAPKSQTVVFNLKTILIGVGIAVVVILVAVFIFIVLRNRRIRRQKRRFPRRSQNPLDKYF